MILATDFGSSVTHHAPWIGTASEAQSRSDQPAPPSAASQPKPAPPTASTKEPTPSKPKKKYSVPSEAVRRLVLSALVAASTQTEIGEELTGGGREAGEVASAQAGRPIGNLGARPGLSAPPPAIGFAVGGRAGLQQGFAGGLGFSRDGATLFTFPATPVRIGGADGRCNDLSNAGFFPDRDTCQAQLGARKRR